jgi:hypothetical protein
MKTKAFILTLSLFLTQISLNATPIVGNEVPIGFAFGYVTGLMPIAGQALFPCIVMATDDPQTNSGLLLGSAVAGHIAGVATVTAALYYGIRGTYRFFTQPEKIAAIQSILTAQQEALNAA